MVFLWLHGSSRKHKCPLAVVQRCSLKRSVQCTRCFPPMYKRYSSFLLWAACQSEATLAACVCFTLTAASHWAWPMHLALPHQITEAVKNKNALLRSYEAAVAEKVTLLESRPTPWHRAKAFWWNSRSEASWRSSFPPRNTSSAAHQKTPSSHWVHSVLLSDSFFPFVLSFSALRFFEDTKTPFTVAIWKITFCAICLVSLSFFREGEAVSSAAGVGRPLPCATERPAAYKCLKKTLQLFDPKPPQSLAQLKDKRSKTQQTHSMSSAIVRIADLVVHRGLCVCDKKNMCASVVGPFSKALSSLLFVFECETVQWLAVTSRSTVKQWDDLGVDL